MKIRIGNDIKLRVRLLGKRISGGVNIKSVKAFLINKTAEQLKVDDLRKKTRFLSRYPVQPFVDAYTSTACNINSTGYPTYRAFPQGHVVAPWHGYGLHPRWDYVYRPIPRRNLTEFLAPVKATDKKDTIEVFFPADAQLFPGEYKLVVVAKIFMPGYAFNNLRTVTMDYENVFTLVNSSEEGVDSDVTLVIGGDGGPVDIKGDTNVVPGKTYTLSTGSVDGVRWYCDNPNVKFIQTFKNSVIYKIEHLDSEDQENTITIFALSEDGDQVRGQIDIVAHNYPTGIVLKPASSLEYPITLNYLDQKSLIAYIKFENGEMRPYIYKNGEKTTDIITWSVQKDGGIDPVDKYIKITYPCCKSECKDIKIVNINDSLREKMITITCELETNNRLYSEDTFILCKSSSTHESDIYAESGSYSKESGKIQIDRNDGNSFEVDMSPETLWYEG